MKKQKKMVQILVLAVIIGSCFLPGAALCTVTVLDEFKPIPSLPGVEYYGDYGRVILDVWPGYAAFDIYVTEAKFFSFYTSLTLQPENFVSFEDNWRTLPAPPGTPLTGEIMLSVSGREYPNLGFEIINPNIVSEDQFGFYYAVDGHVYYPDGFGLYGTLTNSIPEPTTVLLLGSGLIGLAGLWRKKFFKK